MAQKPFVVIGADILTSSVWSESAFVRLVWITLLLLCDTEGYVAASVPGIANTAGVALSEAEEALRRLQEPDPYSRTKAHEGRRIASVERGWQILNFQNHLDRVFSERSKSRERMRRFREKKREVTHSDVTVTEGIREKGKGNNEQNGRTDGLPANPLIAGRRPQMESEGYRLIREIAEYEREKDPTEILLEAARWEGKDGRARSKVRLETMSDDHLIRTVHDLKSILEDCKRGKAKAGRRA